METRKKMGRPKTGAAPFVGLKLKTNLKGKEIKAIIQKGRPLFSEFKKLAIMVKRDMDYDLIKEQSNIIIKMLSEDREFIEILKKWEEDVD